MKLQIRYFAWVRERIGQGSEFWETDCAIVQDLIAELCERDNRYAAAFADISALQVAVDQELTDFSASLSGAREVAFFPPMTGG